MGTTITTVTAIQPEEVIENAARGFVRNGWDLSEQRTDWLLLTRGPDGTIGCLLLFLFLPWGLAYIFTDLGKKKLFVKAKERGDGQTDVEIMLSGSGRDEAEDFAKWLETVEAPEDE